MTSETTSEQATSAPAPTRRRRKRRARGSTYQRSDGRWCGELALKGGGRKYVYGATEGEVERKLTAHKATLDQGGALADDRLTVTAVVDAFIENREGNVRPRTMESYRYLVEQQIKPHMGKMRAATLTTDALEKAINKRVRDGVSPSMAHHVLVVLRMAFKLAVQRRNVGFNPADGVRGPKVERKILAPLDAADTQKFLTAARAHRLAAVWFFAASLGMRYSEIAGLRWRDVDLDGRTVTIRHQLYIARAAPGVVGDFVSRAQLVPPKTKRALRTLAMSPALVALLRERKKAQAAEKLECGKLWRDKLGLMFTCVHGEPLDVGTLNKAHDALCTAAKVRRVRFHDLRHGAATTMLAAGVDPATLSATLGHSRVAFTLDTYVHATSPRIDDALGRLAGALDLQG